MNRWKQPLLLLGCVALAGSEIPASERPTTTTLTRSGQPPECVPCDMLFSRLGASSSEGTARSQYVEMQLRGEPKSGTGFMHEWASGALYHVCGVLKRMFGKDTCRMTWTRESTITTGPATNRTMTFEPGRRSAGAPCACDGVARVVISVSKLNKHTLPVDPSCAWYHTNKIASVSPSGIACRFSNHRPAENYSDLWHCVQEAACNITDHRQQLVVMRDPRPVAVSSYFYRLNGNIIKKNTDRDEYIMTLLPHVCQWMSVRHILFTGILPKHSTVFWYNDTLADPLDFHNRFLESVGLHVPAPVVAEAVDAAVRHDFAFNAKRIDKHPGGGEAVLGRSWVDEVGPETVADMKDVLTVWLPPALQAKLIGV